MIFLGGKHILEFQIFNLLLGDGKLRVHLCLRGLSHLLEIEKHRKVVYRCLHGFPCIGPVLLLLDFFEDLLGALRVVPKIRRMCKLLFLSYLLKSVIDVKDASSEHQHDRKVLSVALVS
jgi:hypothetical protein